MDKRQLIDAIRNLNEHAEAKFLQQFEESDLAQYLHRLEQASVRNVSLKHWSRAPKRGYRMVS